ncbi:MAG: hypothetical protein DSZ09_03590 [Sulfurovum sp.]|nr:MAG: hypothetical protein DSZ09_03590 [Sulfurovum sp.]
MEEEKASHDVSEETVEVKALTSQPHKTKKHTEAKALVEEAKNIIAASESEMENCQLILDENLHDYATAKNNLHHEGLDEANSLLSEFGYPKEDLEETSLENQAIFETKEEDKPVVLKDVHSGRFTGFILSLLAGLATFISLIYVATEQLGLTLNLDTKPSNETINSILTWFSTAVGLQPNMYVGATILGFAIFLVMWIVYAIRVALKGSSNLQFANKQMKETQKYIVQKNNCKVEMDRIDMHIKDAINTLQDYAVILTEQNGKLKRVIYFEGPHTNLSDYHNTSMQIIKETKNLIGYIQAFITTPISKEGKLSEESTHALHHAKEGLQKFLNTLA